MEVINQHNEGTFRAALDDCHYFSPWVQESFHVNKKKKRFFTEYIHFKNAGAFL